MSDQELEAVIEAYRVAYVNAGGSVLAELERHDWILERLTEEGIRTVAGAELLARHDAAAEE